MRERFVVVTEEGQYLFVHKFTPENTQKKVYLKDNKHNGLYFARKYARKFLLGHYLFLGAHSFPRASLLEKCAHLRTDNARKLLSVHIFAPNIVYITAVFSARARPLVFTYHGQRKTRWGPSVVFSFSFIEYFNTVCHHLEDAFVRSMLFNGGKRSTELERRCWSCSKWTRDEHTDFI